MSTVTGIVGVGVAILVTVIVFGPSDLLEVSKMSTVAGIVRVGVARGLKQKNTQTKTKKFLK